MLYPVLPDVDHFEDNLKQLLEGRRRAGGMYEPDKSGLIKPFGMSISFLSLCFAVLASGCQLSDLPGIQREMTSWIYGKPFLAKTWMIVDNASVLLLPVSAHAELCITAFCGNHPGSVDYQQCAIL